MIAPNTLNKDDYRDATDYGVIQKIRAGDHIYFAMSGLGSRATQGCGWYLFHKWRGHVSDPEDFAVLLKFPGGLDFSNLRIIDRRTGKPT